MKSKKVFKCLLLAVGLIGVSLPVFSVEAYVSALYREIDIAFVNRSLKDLDSILSSNVRDDNYYLLENYVLKKIRHLIIKEDYEFATQANIIVIDNDIDNIDAIEMYTTIATALKEQEKREQALAAQREAALAKLELEKQRQKIAVEKDFQSIQTAEGNTVYLNEADKKYSSTFWNLRFGMANIDLASETQSKYNSVRYGLSGDFTYEYSFDKLTIGGDVGGEAVIVAFANDDKTVLGNVYIAPKIGYTPLSRNLFLRIGFNADLKFETLDEGETPSSLHGNFLTPMIGVSFSKIKLGKLRLDGGVDYYIGHLANKDLNFAMGGVVSLRIPFLDMEKVRLGFNIGVKDTFYVKSSGIENRARLVLAIGAENVAK